MVSENIVEQPGLHNYPELTTLRRELRKQMTPAEARMWTYLQDKQLAGRKFRRQHSFGGYVLDFYCPCERLAVELDGEPHFQIPAAEYDRERDIFVARFGVRVLRFDNRRVFDDPDGVLESIVEHFGWYDGDV